jgi:HlyD family secretion protein
MRADIAAALLAALLLTACAGEPPALQGTLEWDRIALPTEASERVLELAVREGETVSEGQLIARLDPARAEARLARVQADRDLAAARLAEAVQGPRAEAIEATRAGLAAARVGATDAAREVERLRALRREGQIAQRELDRAEAALDRARAEQRGAEARLAELLRGTRDEQLTQAAAALAASEAALEEAQIVRARLDLHAPRAGRVDALPFKPGDQPPPGAVVASLLVGEGPYARIFVPASQRAGLAPGARFRVRIEGIDASFDARLRQIASEPAFTPYYALSGDDASRLVYRAELSLLGEVATLPAGLALTAEALADDR